MKNIPIQAIPNQSFSIILDSNTWNIVLKTVEDITVVSLNLNGVDVVDSARAVAGSFVIPSKYEESGNFIFVTGSNQLPYYTEFGVTQALIYASADELANIRTPIVNPITAADFNPLGALPLRFSPQGYT